MATRKKVVRKRADASARERRHAQRSEATRPPRVSAVGALQMGIYFAFGVAVVLVSFVGLSPSGPQVVEGQVARVRIIAEIPFSYASDILTAERTEAHREQIPPVYRLSFEPYSRFSRFARKLVRESTEIYPRLEGIPGPDQQVEIVRATQLINENAGTFAVSSEDLTVLISELSREQLSQAFDETLMILRNLYREGIYDDKAATIGTENTLSFYNIEKDSGHIVNVEVLSEEDALRELRINLSALDVSRDVSSALFRIARVGLQPNLQFDQARTEQRRAEILAGIEPVTIDLQAGESIIEPGTTVTPLDLERLAAYRTTLRERQTEEPFLSALMWDRILMTFAVVCAAAIFVQIYRARIRHTNRLILLIALVTLVNLAVIRLILEFGDSASVDGPGRNLVAVLPYLAPVALGPMIVAVLRGTGAGVAVAFLVAFFNAVMQGNSLPVFIVSLIAALVAIYASRKIQVRTRVVRAGALSGATLAICAFFVSIREGLEAVIILQQIGSALGVGVVTGIAVVGFLPLLESLFKYTTDITLLELTDFNHPLLRRMQMEAPGSYHHSLMVANLAENAAVRVDANPLVCRVCALFHDIGKTIKPEYFTENQRDGINPHIDRNPSMSALIIKAHVKEGVAMARQAKLPGVIVDVIQQHHGTSLIQYFYYRALENQKKTTPPIFPGAPQIPIDEVNETTYRYEGPLPQFKESAIIFFADSVEAASRSLKKVTPQSIEELVHDLMRARIDDGQLDECPLTVREIAEIRRSFIFTLTNMLHSRVAYPGKDADGGGSAAAEGPPSPEEEANRATGQSRSIAQESQSVAARAALAPTPSPLRG